MTVLVLFLDVHTYAVRFPFEIFPIVYNHAYGLAAMVASEVLMQVMISLFGSPPQGIDI